MKSRSVPLIRAKDSGLTVTSALTGVKDGAAGEDIVVGDATVTAYAVAGHTAGSMMYLVNGVLFFGDAATGAADGHIKAPPAPFSDDVDQGVASLHRLATTLQGKSITTFAFAHAGPMPADLAKITAITP